MYYIRQGYRVDQSEGGGFIKPATSQLGLLWEIKTAFVPYGLAICVLSYNLAPEAQYPVQLEQASDLLRYLLNEKCRKPGDVRTLQSRDLLHMQDISWSRGWFLPNSTDSRKSR